MTTTTTIRKHKKIDLREYPHFFSPAESKLAPKIETIVGNWMDRDLDIVALTSCHTTGGIDYRWRDYVSDGLLKGTLTDPMGREYNSRETSPGVVEVTRWTHEPDKEENSSQQIIILNGQNIRATYDGRLADINIIGVNQNDEDGPVIIEPGRDIYRTAEEARKYGALILLPQVDGKTGLNLIDAVTLYQKGLADAIELSAEESTNELEKTIGYRNQQIREKLFPQGNSPEKEIRTVSVSGAHNYKLTGRSLISSGDEKLHRSQITIQDLREIISSENYQNQKGRITKIEKITSKFAPHIISSGLDLLIGGKRREATIEFLRNMRKR